MCSLAAKTNLQRLNNLKYDESETKFASEIKPTLPKKVPLTTLLEIEDNNGKTGNGSTDVGDVSWVVPTAGFSTACWVPGTSAHSWQAVAAGGTKHRPEGNGTGNTPFSPPPLGIFSTTKRRLPTPRPNT